MLLNKQYFPDIVHAEILEPYLAWVLARCKASYPTETWRVSYKYIAWQVDGALYHGVLPSHANSTKQLVKSVDILDIGQLNCSLPSKKTMIELEAMLRRSHHKEHGSNEAKEKNYALFCLHKDIMAMTKGQEYCNAVISFYKFLHAANLPLQVLDFLKIKRV